MQTINRVGFTNIAVHVALLIISKRLFSSVKRLQFYSKKEAFALSAVSKDSFSFFFVIVL